MQFGAGAGKEPVNTKWTSFGRKEESSGDKPFQKYGAGSGAKTFGSQKGKATVGGSWGAQPKSGTTAKLTGTGGGWIKSQNTEGSSNLMGNTVTPPWEKKQGNESQGGIMGIIKKKEEAKQEGPTAEELEQMYSIVDQDELESDIYQFHRNTCWNICQPGGMRIKPAPQQLKDFESQSENLECNVISSMLFYYTVDEEADVKTRIRALYGAEALIKKSKNYHEFFKQNEHNLDVIDIDSITEKNAAAGKEAKTLMEQIKKQLSIEFGAQSNSKTFDPLKMQQGIEVEKTQKQNARDFLKGGNSKATNSLNDATGGDLLGMDLLGGDDQVQPSPAEKSKPLTKKNQHDPFGFISKKATSQTQSAELVEQNLLGDTKPAKSVTKNDFMSLGFEEEEIKVPSQPQTKKTSGGGLLDIDLDAPITNSNSHKNTDDFDLLSGL